MLSLKVLRDKDIIKYAESLISEDNRKFETIIDNLERTRIQLEENNRLAEKVTVPKASSCRKELAEQGESSAIPTTRKKPSLKRQDVRLSRS